MSVHNATHNIFKSNIGQQLIKQCLHYCKCSQHKMHQKEFTTCNKIMCKKPSSYLYVQKLIGVFGLITPPQQYTF